jgi:hypothetical protein
MHVLELCSFRSTPRALPLLCSSKVIGLKKTKRAMLLSSRQLEQMRAPEVWQRAQLHAEQTLQEVGGANLIVQ